MSIIYTENDCCLISHKQFINNIYEKNVSFNEDNSNSNELKLLRIKESVFGLNTPYSKKLQQTGASSSETETKERRKMAKKKINNKNSTYVDSEENNFVSFDTEIPNRNTLKNAEMHFYFRFKKSLIKRENS